MIRKQLPKHNTMKTNAIFTKKHEAIILCVITPLIGVFGSIFAIKCERIYEKNNLVWFGTILTCITLLYPIVLYQLSCISIKKGYDRWINRIYNDMNERIVTETTKIIVIILSIIMIIFGWYCSYLVIDYGGDRIRDYFICVGIALACITGYLDPCIFWTGFEMNCKEDKE